MDLLQTAETAVSQDRHTVCVIILNYLNRNDEILITESVGYSERSPQFSQTTRRQI
jgi:hypothetical protein